MIMYNTSYINKLEQFGYIYCTVITNDDTNTYPQIRVDKQYSVSISHDFLLNDAINDIYVYNNELIDQSQITIDYSGIDQ